VFPGNPGSPTEEAIAILAQLGTLQAMQMLALLQTILLTINTVNLEIVGNIGADDEDVRRLQDLRDNVDEFARRIIDGREQVGEDEIPVLVDVLENTAAVAGRMGVDTTAIVERTRIYVDAVRILLDTTATEVQREAEEENREEAVDEAVRNEVGREAALQTAVLEQNIRAAWNQLAGAIEESLRMAKENLELREEETAEGSAKKIAAAKEAVIGALIGAGILGLLELRDLPVLAGANWQGGLAFSLVDPATDARAPMKKNQLKSNLEKIKQIFQQQNAREAAAQAGSPTDPFAVEVLMKQPSAARGSTPLGTARSNNYNARKTRAENLLKPANSAEGSGEAEELSQAQKERQSAEMLAQSRAGRQNSSRAPFLWNLGSESSSDEEFSNPEEEDGTGGKKSSDRFPRVSGKGKNPKK
jgi:hypothetical protein